MGDTFMSVIVRIVLILVLTIAFTGGVSCSKGKDSAAKTTITPNPNSPVPSITPNPNSPVPSIGTTQSADIRGEPGQPQTVDVISGRPVARSVFADYNGERVYFCCENSKMQFQQKADWYLQKIREKNIILEKAPTQR